MTQRGEAGVKVEVEINAYKRQDEILRQSACTSLGQLVKQSV